MRVGSKWIATGAAGLVLIAGGIGVASAMGNDDRSANVTSNATLTDDRGTQSSQDSASDRTDDRGTQSGQDSASGRTDDRGTQSGQDSASDRNDDRGTVSGRDGNGTVTGTNVQRASAAALAAVPGATVREVERATGGAAYHVELIQRDGAAVEVDLDASFHTVKVERSGHDG